MYLCTHIRICARQSRQGFLVPAYQKHIDICNKRQKPFDRRQENAVLAENALNRMRLTGLFGLSTPGCCTRLSAKRSSAQRVAYPPHNYKSRNDAFSTLASTLARTCADLWHSLFIRFTVGGPARDFESPAQTCSALPRCRSASGT